MGSASLSDRRTSSRSVSWHQSLPLSRGGVNCRLIGHDQGLSVELVPRRYFDWRNKPQRNRIVADFAGFTAEVRKVALSPGVESSNANALLSLRVPACTCVYNRYVVVAVFAQGLRSWRWVARMARCSSWTLAPEKWCASSQQAATPMPLHAWRSRRTAFAWSLVRLWAPCPSLSCHVWTYRLACAYPRMSSVLTHRLA
jgi:hypothetical protein